MEPLIIGFGILIKMKKYNSLNDFVQKNAFNQYEPSIIHNYVKEMPCYTKWDDRYLIEIFEGEKIRCESYALSNDIKKATNKHISFKSFRKKMTKHKMYMAQIEILKEYPTLANDVLIPTYIKKLPQVCLYYGPESVGTKLHYDYGDNIYCNIKGIKEFILIEPKKNIIKTDNESDWTNFAIDSIDSVITQKTEIKLYDGDSLFIPKGWWHETKNITKSLGFSIMYNQ